MTRQSALFLLGALMLVPAGATTQAQDDTRARTLDEQLARIYDAREYEVPRFGPARWMADGTAYTTVEDAGTGGSKDPPYDTGSKEPAYGRDIVRYDSRTGERSVIVPGSRLTPAGAKSPLSIDDYQWSADGRRLLIFTNTARVWRQNTRGDYWVLDIETGALTQVGKGKAPSSLMFAKFSPDGTDVAYVRENNVYLERLEDGRVKALTTDGSETTINGTSDWVYEEELGVRDGFRWSPDGRHIAFWQFDTTGVGVFSLINDTDALYPVITRIPYPKAGTTNSAVRIGVVDVDSKKIRWMKTPGDPRDDYLARLRWLDDRTLAIQQLNRLQNRHDLLLADVRSGEVRRVFRDESDTWVEVGDEVQWIDEGRSFLWLSERDGWQHLFRVPRDGGEARLLTRFDADITDLAGLNEAEGWVYFIASPGNAAQRYLYRSRLDGTGAPERDAGAAGHPRVRHGAGRPPRVPHLLAIRHAAGHGCRGSGGAPLASSTDRHIRACRKARPRPRAARGVLRAGHRRRGHPGWLDAQAVALRPGETLPVHRARIW